MYITVALCTFDRAESLRRTLNSLSMMYVPQDIEWEVVVVNNNSTDNTDEVIASFTNSLPIRREFERRAGKSNACNRAVDSARGDYIVWTDDDVIVDPGWLAAYVAAFRRWPQAAVFGGPIIPRYEEPVAKWVRESEMLLGGPYARRDFGDEPVPLASEGNRVPYGANFALRMQEQRTLRYDPELGPGPTRRRLGDETSLIHRLLESGSSGYWVPTARVDHCIGHERQTLAYIARYFGGMGETIAVVNSTAGVPFYFGVPRWVWRQLIVGWVGFCFHRLLSPAPTWLKHFCAYNSAKGAIRYWWGEGRRISTQRRPA